MTEYFKNAGIQSIPEAITRLYSGEELYTKHGEMIEIGAAWEQISLWTKTKPRRPVNVVSFKSWKVRELWETVLDQPGNEGVLCYVWNSYVTGGSVGLVTHYRSTDRHPYVTLHNLTGPYRYAEPLTLEEAKAYIAECQPTGEGK